MLLALGGGHSATLLFSLGLTGAGGAHLAARRQQDTFNGSPKVRVSGPCPTVQRSHGLA
jgi:hypothetical protein